jgi:AcrR family transcriptional regulator
VDGPAARTRRRLIDAAGELFAARGYQNASVRDICGRAGANLAAVKYHFGNKEGLYREVLLGAHRELRDREPIPRLEHFKTAELALTEWIRFTLRLVLLRRPSHPYVGRVLARELQQPTAVLTDLVQLVMQPVRKELERIIGTLLGPANSRARRGQLANFVLGLCAFHEFGRPVLERAGFPPPTREADVDRLADEVGAFALSGIRDARRRASHRA